MQFVFFVRVAPDQRELFVAADLVQFVNVIWVEVVLPIHDGTGDAIAWTFDPTHASRGGLNYVTIAVGGDYHDVAPTSGTYQAPVRGRLQSRKRVTLTRLDYAV